MLSRWGGWGVQSKATKNRWTELLLLEGNKMNHTRIQASGLGDDGGTWQEADGDACWDTGITGQTPCCQCPAGDKAGEATEGNALYSSFEESGETGLKNKQTECNSVTVIME